ncbi:MAG: hypothetical protein IH631_01840 [Candidatus Thorarchaeota archaeon]|nr:hypothetical protein [Candidatus Thorarchaeota archaeon]
MSLVIIVIAVFMLLELTNILTLYFKKDTSIANGIGVFKAWEKSKTDSEINDFVKYLINWVAGTKLIFLSLLTVILLFGSPDLHPWVLLALIISIASFYVGLFPLARKMDREDMLNPKGYSKTLAAMITVFIIVFLILYLWPYLIPFPMPSFW